MAEFQSFNPNPRAAKVGDCAVRAVANRKEGGVAYG
nr:MAG TPA: hypothetical protein [Caudoviricetes sp.]